MHLVSTYIHLDFHVSVRNLELDAGVTGATGAGSRDNHAQSTVTQFFPLGNDWSGEHHYD